MGKKYSQEDIVHMIANKHGDNVEIDFSTYSGASNTCRFVDKDYGEFWNIPYNVYACNQGHRQRFIEEILKKPVDIIRNKIKKIHKGDVEIIEESYNGSDKKCSFMDKDYGEFIAYPYNIINHKQRHPEYKKLHIKDCMKPNTPRRARVREIILEKNLLKYECSECGQLPIWMDKELTLQLHHINGISTDNRIENLCFLCPNCHTQTQTYYRGLK